MKLTSCPSGKVSLSTKDPMAQDLLWEYANRRQEFDITFSIDLKFCLIKDGYVDGLKKNGV